MSATSEISPSPLCVRNATLLNSAIGSVASTAKRIFLRLRRLVSSLARCNILARLDELMIDKKARHVPAAARRRRCWHACDTRRYSMRTCAYAARPRSAIQRTRDTHHIMRLIVRARRLVVPPLACALVGLSACSAQRSAATPGASAPATSAAARVVTERDVRRLLSALSDDWLGGRMRGTGGAARAARISAAERRRIGRSPAGDSGYFQRVPIGLPASGDRAHPMLFDSFAA